MSNLILAIAFTLYVLHTLLWPHWIVDDAGISLAYSVNIAEGYGIVAQPGAEPVEGFSNPTWVFLLVPLAWMNLLDPFVTPKIVALILTFFVFLNAREFLAESRANSGLAQVTTLGFLGLNSSFVIWTSSGLENALYAFLLSLLMLVTLRALTRNTLLRFSSIGSAAVLAALLALTRPDGITLAALYPAAVLYAIARGDIGSGTWRARFSACIKPGLLYLAVVGVLFGGYVVFRLEYFGVPLANTYYAKVVSQAPSLRMVARESLAELKDLLVGLGGIFGAIYLSSAILLSAHSAKRLAARPGIFVAGLALVISGMNYFILPSDYMLELRFATLFLFSLAVLAGIGADELGNGSFPRLSARSAGAAVALVLLGATATSFVPRSLHWRQRPTLDMATFKELYVDPYSAMIREFQLVDASALMPDLGAPLLFADFRLYDLAGLCDRRIARVIGAQGPQNLPEPARSEYYDYVFETMKPTFIRTHFPWTAWTQLEADPRFARDYIALHESTLPGRPVDETGDYIRREIAGDHTAAMVSRWASLTGRSPADVAAGPP